MNPAQNMAIRWDIVGSTDTYSMGPGTNKAGSAP